MTSIDAITLDVADTAAAERFYRAAFGLEGRLRFEAAEPTTNGFRGFTVSLLVAQPADADELFTSAVGAGASVLKPVAKSLWGYGGVLQAPDGAIWKIATGKKKDTAPASRQIDSMVLLVAVADVGASKKFYADHGLEVGKSFGKYVEFAMPTSPVKLALYGRNALAKDAGVAPAGSGSHRLTITGDAGTFVDPDGFAWRDPR